MGVLAPVLGGVAGVAGNMGRFGGGLGSAGGIGGIAAMLAQLMKARQGVKGTPPIVPLPNAPIGDPMVSGGIGQVLGGLLNGGMSAGIGAGPDQLKPYNPNTNQWYEPGTKAPVLDPSMLPPGWGPPGQPNGDPSLKDTPLQDMAMHPSISAFMQNLADRKPSQRPWWSAGQE